MLKNKQLHGLIIDTRFAGKQCVPSADYALQGSALKKGSFPRTMIPGKPFACIA